MGDQGVHFYFKLGGGPSHTSVGSLGPTWKDRATMAGVQGIPVSGTPKTSHLLSWKVRCRGTKTERLQRLKLQRPDPRKRGSRKYFLGDPGNWSLGLTRQPATLGNPNLKTESPAEIKFKNNRTINSRGFSSADYR